MVVVTGSRILRFPGVRIRIAVGGGVFSKGDL
jgi:hypothetical protein